MNKAGLFRHSAESAGIYSEQRSDLESRWRAAFYRVGLFVFCAHLFLGLLALMMAPLVSSESWWWLGVFCIPSLGMLGYLIARSLRANPAGIFYETGLFLCVSSGIYYAFGPMLFVVGPVEAANYSQSWYRVDASEAVWLTGLNFIGLGLAGISYLCVRLPLLARITEVAARRWNWISPAGAFTVFLLVGLVAQYLFVLPFELRLTESVPSGAVRQLARSLTIALIIGWSYRNSGPWWLGGFATLLLFAEVLTGLLMFNKTHVLVSVLAAGLGYYFANHSVRKLLVTALACLMIYALAGPVVTFGRNELAHRGGGVPVPADLSGRFDITRMYFTGGESHVRQEEISGSWWARFNYLSTQQSAVSLFEQGYGSDDFKRLIWIFVPRLLYPDKPAMSGAGVELTEKVTGSRHSSTGIGVFVDGYYMLGWLGVLLASVTYGFSLRAYSVIARTIVRNRCLIMYPLVFAGIYTGLRSDGWWSTDVAGSMVLTLVLLALFRTSPKL